MVLFHFLGQYDGQRKPMVEYHIKIAGFDEKILTMSSIRKPKRITIRGHDQKEYKFLVKGGEDLRQDQRIEKVCFSSSYLSCRLFFSTSFLLRRN